MLTGKNINKLILVFLYLAYTHAYGQKPAVYKINDLLKRIHNNSDTTYVVNFWATWCKPCVAELPEFEKLHSNYSAKKIKVLLVSMDFKEELGHKLKAFLDKHKYSCEVVLLDELNGNDFINKVSESWSGAIPATLITGKNKSTNEFIEKKVTYDDLVKAIQ
ncbi:MAG: TlpA family protein disulfide reductase [Bacteroidota bacterium]|jgi:thiol-disulfide isomerase/thioredoxin|nr:TlpA family protein disulfide reductase [Bacteroidota bacterium]